MIKTTVVGSYPVPSWLQAFSTREALRDAMLAVIKTQELAGIDVVADGELYRWDVNHAETNGMIDYFVTQFSGVRCNLGFEELERWRAQPEMKFRAKPAAVVLEPLGHGTLDLRNDYELFRDLTDRPKKFTVTSPFMLARTLADEVYASLEERIMAIASLLREQVARIDADILQVDEANVTGDPEHEEIAAAGINEVLAGANGETGVHLCFGNYGGQTIQQGTYDALVKFLNRLQCDHLVLEMARRPDRELQLLAEVDTRIGIGVGVIDIKDNEIESATEVARRIEQAADVAGAERIHYVHPDCGFWMLPRSVADGKMNALVAGRDLFLGRSK